MYNLLAHIFLISGNARFNLQDTPDALGNAFLSNVRSFRGRSTGGIPQETGGILQKHGRIFSENARNSPSSKNVGVRLKAETILSVA